jgi:cell division GTPase FtsZ
MPRGLIPLGMNTANQALAGFTKEAQIGTEREIAGKKLELTRDVAMQGSQQKAFTDIISTALSFITFGLGGGFSGTTPTTPKVEPQMEPRSQPMQFGQPSIGAGRDFDTEIRW